MDWITEHIAIGNFLDAREAGATVDAILCLKEGCCEDREDTDAFCVPLIDGKGNSRESVKEALDTIASLATTGSEAKILVHCHAGRSRSVCIVAAYLAIRQGITDDEALGIVGAKRAIELSPGIREIFDLARQIDWAWAGEAKRR